MASNKKLPKRLNGEKQTAKTPAFLEELQKEVENKKNHQTIDVSLEALAREKKTDFDSFAALDNTKSNNLNDFETPNNIA